MRSLLLSGPTTASAALRFLGVSRPTFSRMVRAWGPRLVVSGRARATRYMGAREMLDVGGEIPVTEIREDGTARQLGVLYGVLPLASDWPQVAGAVTRHM